MPAPESTQPLVAVTATTEIIRGAPRVRLNRAYVDALTGAGVIPLVVPPLAPEAASRILDAVGGLVLTGGEDVDPARYGAAAHSTVSDVHRERDASEIALLAEARRRRLPTLAICRGVQVVNVALGGTLVQDLPSQRPGSLSHQPGGERDARTHALSIESASRLATMLGARELVVNSMHHQALDRVAAGLRVTATAPDGVIEAVETPDTDWWMVGVQWHPEELVGTSEPWDRRLFAAFAAAARGRG